MGVLGKINFTIFDNLVVSDTRLWNSATIDETQGTIFLDTTFGENMN